MKNVETQVVTEFITDHVSSLSFYTTSGVPIDRDPTTTVTPDLLDVQGSLCFARTSSNLRSSVVTPTVVYLWTRDRRTRSLLVLEGEGRTGNVTPVSHRSPPVHVPKERFHLP